VTSYVSHHSHDGDFAMPTGIPTPSDTFQGSNKTHLGLLIFDTQSLQPQRLNAVRREIVEPRSKQRVITPQVSIHSPLN